MVSAQAVLIALVGLATALVGPPVVTLLSPSYSASAELIGWLALGFVFWGFYQLPMNMISLVAGRTGWVWTLGISAAVVNLGLIVAFVPEYGIEAAAIASAAGYLVLMILSLFYAHRLDVRVPVDAKRLIPTMAGLAVLYAAGVEFVPDSGLVGLIARSVLVLVTIGFAAFVFRDEVDTASALSRLRLRRG